MLKKKLASSLVVGAVLAGGASVSHGYAVATSWMNIYDFSFTNSLTGVKLNVPTDITFENGEIPQNDGDTAADLNGDTDTNTNQADAGLELNIVDSCVGACAGYNDNDFTYIADGDPAPATYVRGDALLQGSVVDIFDAGIEDADAKLLSETSLASGPNVGSSAGNNLGVDAAFSFVADYDGELTISFSAELFMRAALTADEAGTVANANSTFTISLVSRDGADDYLFNTFPLNNSVGAITPGVDNSKYFLFDTASGDPDKTGNSFSETFDIREGVIYDASITGTVQTNATLERQQVPEPATLALFGLGLLGLGVARRRSLA